MWEVKEEDGGVSEPYNQTQPVCTSGLEIWYGILAGISSSSVMEISQHSMN